MKVLFQASDYWNGAKITGSIWASLSKYSMGDIWRHPDIVRSAVFLP